MSLFRKKPVVIEAEQFQKAASQLPFAAIGVCCWDGSHWYVRTLEGPLYISEGDWIIKGINGEFYTCKSDIFAVTYEAVELAMPSLDERKAASA